MNRLLDYLAARAPFLGLAALLGSFVAVMRTEADTHDEEGVRAVIEETTGMNVGAFFWEPSRGMVVDYLWGRPLLFEGRERAEEREVAPRDIHRVLLRLSPEGSIVSTSASKNLTRTRSGDERGLTGRNHIALFATSPPDAPASIGLLNLKGEGEASHVDLLGRLQLGLTRFIETGSWAGIARSDLLSLGTERNLTIELKEEELLVQAKKESFSESTERIFARGALELKSVSSRNFRFINRAREPMAWSHWGANAGRSLFGNDLVAWTEGRLFSTLDQLRRAGTSTNSSRGQSVPPPTELVSNLSSSRKADLWPPAPIVVPGRRGTQDGTWEPVENTVLEKEKIPLFYKTILHTDPTRPYAELHLVAMDMRQLELGIRAGYEEPEPDLGPSGSGHLPADTAPRVVATFNGAFKASHGRYGMMEDGRVLVAPVLDAATVFIDESGAAGLGTWNSELAQTPLHSYRQNLDPLVANGKINPADRKVWGDHLYGSGVAVERSALCLHRTGQLIYAWATEATGATLASGLALSGCVYAMHLDMNPGHCAFLFNEVKSIDPINARGEPLDLRMKVNENRYVRWSPKDFFYVARRAPLPASDGIMWSTAPGTQPELTHLPATQVGQKSVGGIDIELDRIDARRFAFRLQVGTAESKENAVPSLSDEDAGRALLALGLGHKTRGSRTGLTVDRTVIAPLSRHYASLVLGEETLPLLLPPGEPLTETKGLQIVQLPLLARNGKLLADARELGGNEMRAALCTHPSGNIYVGRMKHDTIAPLVQTLLDLGCEIVVALDRGSHTPPLVQRAGTDSPPHRGYEQTMLYGLAVPMTPRTVLH